MDPSDVSSRTPLETQLRASNARWQAIIESAVDGILVIDQSGRIETVNPAAERLFGYTEAELVGRNVSLLMPSPHREEHDGYLARYLATGEARIIGIGREVTGLRRDGSTFPLHLSVGEIVIEGERRFTGIVHDLTRRVRMEEQFREQTALARLGEMAAVLAHEIKNPLAGIRGVVQVIAGRMQSGGAEAEMMGEVIARIDALDAMMKDVLVFARPRRPKMQPVEIVPLVRLTAELLKQGADLREVEIDVRGESPAVNGDPEMLKMVFQNLLLNSAHATKSKGRIRVDVSKSDTDCTVTVEDDGPGVPLEIQGKIFTPFFTTKARGTGLGLATAKRFVEAHQGEISIECPPAGGTAVHVRLPLSGV